MSSVARREVGGTLDARREVGGTLDARHCESEAIDTAPGDCRRLTSPPWSPPAMRTSG
jgi:hypothetical protein